VRSAITKKKLLRWIQEGLVIFDKYVEKEKETLLLLELVGEIYAPHLNTSKMRNSVNTANEQPVSPFEPMHKLPELLITPYEGQNASFFTIDSKGAMIGKQSSHTMPIFEVYLLINS
jgi:hypothetical protein